MTDDEADEFARRIDAAPRADSVQIWFCDGEHGCHRPHVLLLDKDGGPIATFVVPDPHPDGTGFVHDLTGALYRSAVERGDL